MAVARGPSLAAVLLLVSLGLHCSSPASACPESCTCQRATVLNCSSSNLFLVPQPIQDSVTELDLSNNLLNSVTLHQPHHNLRGVWLGSNTITHLSLCIERNLGRRSVRDGRLHRSRPWSRRGCVSWAPTLQMLSVERNQLQQLPEGLEGSESLEVLQLSFNRISSLRPQDLSHLRKLKELDLQHNLITSLHPQMFQDLAQLRVLDLSFNMLTSIHPLMYLSLHNIGTDVRLGGNRWQCDCSIRSLRRRMAYDSSRGLKTWSVLCASPSILSGKDLLQLEEDDLNCFSTENKPELHRDVTVYSGSDILLSCSTQDSTLWMPSGQGSMSQSHAGLLISDVKERDTGLYVCVSEEREVVSVFNLQISKIGGARRNPRSLPRTHRQIIPQDFPNRISQERNQPAAQSDLTLAVCLSVFITFMIAFILGVLARPCIDVLWRRVTKKKSSSTTDSASSIEKRQYDNQAYCSGEELGEVVTHRERRVTFSTIEDINVQYYDTIVRDDQENTNNDAVFESEADEAKDKHTAGNSRSDNTLHQSAPEVNLKDGRENSDDTDADCTHKMKFEPILDPAELEERGSLSSCSHSSLSDRVLHKEKMTKGERTIPRSSQLSEDSVQQNAEVVPQFSLEDRSEIPGFSSEPFADWSPHTNKINPADTDLWQENEEKFEFSDSVRSTSARSSSLSGSFNDSKQIVARTSDEKKQGDVSSSSSYVSEDEPTQYTVNSDQEEEERYRGDIEKNHEISEVMIQNAIFKKQVHGSSMEFNQSDYKHDTQKSLVTQKHSFSSHSSDSDGEPMHSKVKHKTDKGQGKEELKYEYDKRSSRIVTAEEGTRDKVNLGFEQSTPIKRHLHIKTPSPASDSSSGSDSEKKHHAKKMSEKMDIAGLPFQPSLTVSPNSETWFPALDLEHIPHLERRLDIKVLSTLPDSSSSNDSENEITEHIKKSEQWATYIPRLPKKVSQTVCHEHTTEIKRHLDNRPPSSDSSNSSSCHHSSCDSEAETTNCVMKQEQGEINMAMLPIKSPQTISPDPEAPWPALNLEHVPHIKRRLDIKAPSPPPDSSSSSDSEDETKGHTEEQRPGKVDSSGHLYQESPAASHDSGTKWPLLDLEHIPGIKRRLDIKAPSPPPDSSSSSDNEAENTNCVKKQEQGEINMVRLSIKSSQTIGPDPEAPWPALNLEHVPHIKRRLDIKAPSPDSGSSPSSASEDETVDHTQKTRPTTVDVTKVTLQISQAVIHDPQARWPSLDLERISHIKRRLDIKAPSPPPDSSSSSDSEDETTNCVMKQEQGEINMARHPIKSSQTVNPDPETPWPALNLEHVPHIKRRLDIKAPSPPPDSSSSSDSEDETTGHTAEQRPGKVDSSGHLYQESPAASHDSGTTWPLLDLEHIPGIKRHLDIKAPSPPPDSSSSSDSEDLTTNCVKKQEQGEINMVRLPIKSSQTVSPDPEAPWPALNLEHVPQIKRRLDIKAPSPPPDSSSSSDSEDETTNCVKKQEQGEINMVRLPIKSSQTISPDPEAPWPALNLEHVPHIKRRLDIKAPSPDSDSSPSSASEDETVDHTQNPRPTTVDVTKVTLQISQAVIHDPQARWPSLDLERISHIQRRLDIKAPSPPPDSSSSSDSEAETTNCVMKQEQGETQWPAVDLDKFTCIKRRLDVKAPSPPPDLLFSGRSRDHTVEGKKKEVYEIDSGLPKINLSNVPRVKRHLNIKACSPSPGFSSSDESDSGTTDLPLKVEGVGITNYQPGTKLSDFSGVLSVPLVKRCLNINAPDQRAGSCSSNSDNESRPSSSTVKEGQKGEQQTKLHKLSLGIPQNNSRLDIKATSPEPHSPKTDSQIQLEKYTVITDDLGDKLINDEIINTPEINQELLSRWATMNLGVSRFRKRLEITSHTHDVPSLPSSPPPDSPSPPSSIEPAGKEWYVSSQLPVFTDKEVSQKRTSQSETEEVKKKDSMWPQPSLTNIPYVKRALDIRAPVKGESSSSSNSEDKTIEHIVPDLSLGIPRIKRRLNIKAPSPEPSDSPSCSESENDVTRYTVKQSINKSVTSGMTDESQISYKRLIMKTSLPSSNSFSPSGHSQTADHAEMVTESQSHTAGRQNAYFSPVKFPNMSFDIVKKRLKQSRYTTDDNLPPEIRWTGVGRHLPDFSISSLGRQQGEGLSSPQQAPPAQPELPHPDSSNFSSSRSHDRIKQFREKADGTVSLSSKSLSVASSRALDGSLNSTGSTNEIFKAVSEQTRERKGLSALRAMSSERQKWDKDVDHLGKKTSPLFDDHGPQDDPSFNNHMSEDITPLGKRPLTSVAKRRAGDLLYRIPHYRRHDFGDIEPPQEAPPPIPATPPPDEPVGFI